jgi:hypothetical protein
LFFTRCGAAAPGLEALLWGFHNARSGLCFPSYESIAKRAGCARSTVAECIKALEDAGILSWVNRLVRVRERCEDLFGHWGSRVRGGILPASVSSARSAGDGLRQHGRRSRRSYCDWKRLPTACRTLIYLRVPRH